MKLLKNKTKSVRRAAMKHRHELDRASARRKRKITLLQHEIEKKRNKGLFGVFLQKKREADKKAKQVSKRLKKGIFR